MSFMTDQVRQAIQQKIDENPAFSPLQPHLRDDALVDALGAGSGLGTNQQFMNNLEAYLKKPGSVAEIEAGLNGPRRGDVIQALTQGNVGAAQQILAQSAPAQAPAPGGGAAAPAPEPITLAAPLQAVLDKDPARQQVFDEVVAANPALKAKINQAFAADPSIAANLDKLFEDNADLAHHPRAVNELLSKPQLIGQSVNAPGIFASWMQQTPTSLTAPEPAPAPDGGGALAAGALGGGLMASMGGIMDFLQNLPQIISQFVTMLPGIMDSLKGALAGITGALAGQGNMRVAADGMAAMGQNPQVTVANPDGTVSAPAPVAEIAARPTAPAAAPPQLAQVQPGAAPSPTASS